MATNKCGSVLFAWTAAISIAACARDGEDLRVKIDGSSTLFPLSLAAAESYQKRDPVKVEVTASEKVSVGISGTSGGFRRFCAGELDIADASRPIKPREAEACKQAGIGYVEVPVAFDGLAIVVNPQNTWASHITIPELELLWSSAAEGRITRWNQVRVGWPDEPIHLFGAGRDSGTYDYFAEAVLGPSKDSRADYVASEDDDVLVAGVASDRLALGFFGSSYVHKNSEKLRALAVDDLDATNGAGPIALSPASIRDGTYQPFARPLFIYISANSLRRREVQLFVAHYLSNGRMFAERLGYEPLPERAYVLAQERVSKKRLGSAFSDKARIGMSIEQLLAKETY